MKSIPLQNIYNNFSDIYYSYRDKETWKYQKANKFLPYFYQKNPHGQYVGYDGTKLEKIFCKAPHEVSKMRNQDSWESDVLYTKRFIIDNIAEIKKSKTRWIVADIETPIENTKYLNPLKTKKAPYPITFIVAYDNYENKYTEFDYRKYDSEYDMLDDYCKYIKDRCPDLLMYWNGLEFDHPYLWYRIPDLSKKMSPIEMEEFKGKESPTTPALISVIDPMALYHKFTGGSKERYSLDFTAQDLLGEDTWGKTDFINDEDNVLEKCHSDVERTVKIIEKCDLINYFDTQRIFTTCLWTDLPSEKIGWEWRSNNSKPWDMLYLRTAKDMGIILKSKPNYTDEEREQFKKNILFKCDGAYRETFKSGIFKRAIKVDLGSAYPLARIGFCLDEANLVNDENIPDFFPDKYKIEEGINKGYNYWSKTQWGKWLIKNNILAIPVRYRETEDELRKKKDYKDNFPEDFDHLRWIVYLKQNKNNVSAKAFSKPMDWKARLKKELFKKSDKHIKQEYDACKRFGNTGFGISGNRYNRLFNLKLFNANTALVRDLMHYVINRLKELEYDLLLTDTDGVVILTEEDIVDMLNTFVVDWSTNKYDICTGIEFTFEGIFKQIYIGSRCRYMGYLENETGVEEEIKGLQIKRIDSSKFTKIFQKAFLRRLMKSDNINGVEDINNIVERYIKAFKKADILKISTPIVLKKPKEEYKVNQPQFSAIDETKKIDKDFNPQVGDQIFWLYTKDNEDGRIAIDENNKNIVKEIHWSKMLEIHIFNVLVPIYHGLNFGKELLDLAEKYGICLTSQYRNLLLEEYEDFNQLKKYYSKIEFKKRKGKNENILF